VADLMWIAPSFLETKLAQMIISLRSYVWNLQLHILYCEGVHLSVNYLCSHKWDLIPYLLASIHDNSVFLWILCMFPKQDYIDGLVHASRCYDPRNCTHPVCLTLKKLFFHGVRCDIRARNWSGCNKCVFMWKLLLCHSKDCNDVDCSVPRCR
jgi:hypothetical protein